MPNILDGFDEETQKALQAEIDRRVTEAVKTNTAKVTESVTKQLSADFQQQLAAAVEQTKTQTSLTAEEQIAKLTQDLADQRQAFKRSEYSHKVSASLMRAGLTEEAVNTLTPIIVNGSDDDTLDANLNSFITAHTKSIEDALDAQKQTLANNVTPPAGSGANNFQSDPNAAYQAIVNNKDVDPHFANAMGIQFLLNQASSE